MSSARRVSISMTPMGWFEGHDNADGDKALLPWSEYEAMEAVCEAGRNFRKAYEAHWHQFNYFELEADKKMTRKEFFNALDNLDAVRGK